MHGTALLAASLDAGALAATAASAETFKTYSKEGDWEIAVNANVGPGRVGVQRFVGPTSQVQMGIDARTEPKTGYLAILVENRKASRPARRSPLASTSTARCSKAHLPARRRRASAVRPCR